MEQKITTNSGEAVLPNAEKLKIAARAIAALKEGDYEGVAAELGCRPSSSSRSYEVLEGLMRKALEQNGDGSYTELLDAISEAFIADKAGRWDFGGWSHSLCHNFEHYGRGYDDDVSDVSFLNYPHNLEVAEKLVNAAVEKFENCRHLACMPRIIGPILKYNLDQMDLANIAEPFAFFPQSLKSPLLAKLCEEKPEYYADLADFCQSESPDQFFTRWFSRGQEALCFSLEPQLTAAVFERYREIIPPQALASYLQKLPEMEGRPQTLEEIGRRTKLASEAKTVEEGAFIDVEGTLLTSDKRLSDQIVKALDALAARGMKTTIFTGGDPVAATETLRVLGLDEKFLPVRSKSQFEGKLLELLIDDTKCGYQGFGAVSQLRPFRGWLTVSGIECENGQWRWTKEWD
jgi:hypothetical protein